MSKSPPLKGPLDLSRRRLCVSALAVARHSLHLKGMAADVRLAGVQLRTLHAAALGLERGGVGCYPGGDFLHVDTGRVRTW